MNSSKILSRFVPKNLRTIDGYKGRTFRFASTETVEIPMDAGLWSGGSCERYFYLRLSDGMTVTAHSKDSPWNIDRRDNAVRLSKGFALVEHSHFCGKDLGLTFYVHPDDVGQNGLPSAAANVHFLA